MIKYGDLRKVWTNGVESEHWIKCVWQINTDKTFSTNDEQHSLCENLALRYSTNFSMHNNSKLPQEKELSCKLQMSVVGNTMKCQCQNLFYLFSCGLFSNAVGSSDWTRCICNAWTKCRVNSPYQSKGKYSYQCRSTNTYFLRYSPVTYLPKLVDF